MIKNVHGMDSNYSESEDNDQRHAHPWWAINLNHSEPQDKDGCSTSSPIDSKPDNTPPCQTPRECQTRSTALLKKSSMKQTAQQISATSELDLPQPGSEDDDETWLTGPTGCKTTTSIKVAAEACWVHNSVLKDPFHQHSKTQLVAEPDLPRTIAIARGCGLPGPQSQDDDEDSSPIVQELDRAEHTQCSSNYHSTLTLSLGASALGS